MFNIIAPGVHNSGMLRKAITIDPGLYLSDTTRPYVLILLQYRDIFGIEHFFEGHWTIVGIGRAIREFGSQGTINADTVSLEMVKSRGGGD